MGSSQKERERKERERRERERRERERRDREEWERKQREREEAAELEKIKRENERRKRELERLRREKLRREREERERKERERIERERRERERREREDRERQFKIEEEKTRKIESKIKSLRNNINSFKSNFKNNYHNNKENYKEYFEELQDLFYTVENRRPNWNINYPYKEKKDIQQKLINCEIKNLKKFLYINIYEIVDNLGKNKKFSECLEAIEELENNFSLNEIDFLNYQKEDYIKNLKIIKNHCELMLKCNKSKDLFNKGNYNESFRLINELYLNSNTDTERELFSKNIINMKIEHINNITNKNIKLLNSNNNNEIIKESEKIFKQYNDDISLSKPLHEMKIVYCKALQNVILSKKKEKGKKG